MSVVLKLAFCHPCFHLFSLALAQWTSERSSVPSEVAGHTANLKAAQYDLLIPLSAIESKKIA